ncbi:MAG TPA: hypothetical protein GX742_03695 [Acholeplasmataceae bacterium]|nr:hypothetical protein [Acholeplasmataceae bacterium]
MKKVKVFQILIILLSIVFIISTVTLFFGEYLAAQFDVIGIRIAALILSFASFSSSTLFSLLVYSHNKTVTRINDDTNNRAELFRDLQFASNNYSIIEFTDRMLVSKERDNYIERLLKGKKPNFHLVDDRENNVINYPETMEYYNFFTIRIPFRVIEGKMVSNISINELRFDKDNEAFRFYPNNDEDAAQAFILNNELTKRSNMIINIAVRKGSNFFDIKDVNIFSKIKLYLNITSLLGVNIRGLIELYFTNPSHDQEDKHSYKINSSNFKLLSSPTIVMYNQTIE